VARDEFEAVQRETDPLRQARRATELMTLYQQRGTELARLRREAIDKLQADGLSYAEIAAKLGLSKGRIGQIRQSAPAPERALFGVGPITVAIPLRAAAGRSLPVISSEDEIAAQRMTELLTGYGFAVEQFRIPVDGKWKPSGDVVAICGPKSSPVTARALADDPALDFHEDDAGHWIIKDRTTDHTYASPIDVGASTDTDLAYIGRRPVPGATLLIVAGIHALGSIGAVDYLTGHAPDVYREAGRAPFSFVVRSTVDTNGNVAATERLTPVHHAR
jgi:transcriptional regulator with XRE-family HTH domain